MFCYFLADGSKAHITALDNEQSALDKLTARFELCGMPQRLTTVCESMDKLTFPEQSFVLLWAEGSAYIIGIEKALSLWKPLLQSQGYLMVSDMVWRTATPSVGSIEFWNSEYPDIQLVETRIEQMELAGYRVVQHFEQSEQVWSNYYSALA